MRGETGCGGGWPESTMWPIFSETIEGFVPTSSIGCPRKATPTYRCVGEGVGKGRYRVRMGEDGCHLNAGDSGHYIRRQKKLQVRWNYYVCQCHHSTCQFATLRTKMRQIRGCDACYFLVQDSCDKHTKSVNHCMYSKT